MTRYERRKEAVGFIGFLTGKMHYITTHAMDLHFLCTINILLHSMCVHVHVHVQVHAYVYKYAYSLLQQ